eukprot:g20409.t1
MQTCDPVLLIINVLSGRVTDADLEAEQSSRKSNAEGAASLAVPQNFLSQLQALHGAKTWNILEEGQRRLLLLNETDQNLIPILYGKIVSLESIEYATNRLRGLFAKQIIEDAREALATKYGGAAEDGLDLEGLDMLPEMPPELSRFLCEVYEIAQKFTTVFLAGDRMRDAFAPFVAQDSKSCGSKSSAAKSDEADTAGGEPSAKRQKL